jgi:8-oxo-dGTP pyrophosphatase MutT (NUDIX family)
MELRDLYDINRNKTGETIPAKEKAIPKGRYFVTVVIFIQNAKGEFLIQKTSLEKGNKWSSTGGHPSSGESSLEGIVREVKEEIGLDLSNDNLTLFTTLNRDVDFIDLYYINLNVDIKSLVLQEEEVSEIKWMNIDTIEKLIKDKEFQHSHAVFFRHCMKYLNSK